MLIPKLFPPIPGTHGGKLNFILFNALITKFIASTQIFTKTSAIFIIVLTPSLKFNTTPSHQSLIAVITLSQFLYNQKPALTNNPITVIIATIFKPTSEKIGANAAKPILMAGIANPSKPTTINNPDIANVVNIIHFVHSGFFSTHSAIFSIIGVIANKKLFNAGIKIFPIVSDKFSIVFLNTCNEPSVVFFRFSLNPL